MEMFHHHFLFQQRTKLLFQQTKEKVIRTNVKEIRIVGRNTQGVRIIKLSNNEKLYQQLKLMIILFN